MTALPQRLFLGISLIIAGAFTIAANDVLFKVFAGDLTLWQIFALRGIIAIFVLVVIMSIASLISKTSGPSFAKAFGVWPLVRALTFTGTLLAFYAAIPYLHLATVGAANYTAPIFIALLSAAVLGERVSLLGWIGVVVGFMGLLALLQPGTDAFSPWIFLPILGAILYAFTHVITRLKCQDLAPLTLSLSQNIVMMLAGLAVSAVIFLWSPTGPNVAEYPQIFGQWTAPGQQGWIFLAGMALILILASTLIAAAYQAAPPATVATFEYSYLIFAVFWDSILTWALPNGLSMVGVIMIVGAGLLLIRR